MIKYRKFADNKRDFNERWLIYLKCIECILCRIFRTKNTSKRLADGLRSDPLGELKRSPDPYSRTKGAGRENGRAAEGGKRGNE